MSRIAFCCMEERIESITKEYVDEVLAHFEKGDILLLQNEINLLDYIITAPMKKE